MDRAGSLGPQRGAGSLLVILVLLLAMSLITAVSLRSALNQHRLSSNLTHADRAAVEADAGLQNALAYAQANRALVTEGTGNGWNNRFNAAHWETCGDGETAMPCGDGSASLYGEDWYYYGPLPQQLALDNGYVHQTWILSDSIDDDWQDAPDLGCVSLNLTALVPSATVTLIGTVNTLLRIIHPTLSLPATLCLPISFEAIPAPIPPSEENPAMVIATRAENTGDPRAARADAQLHVQKSSVFTQIPLAALTAQGTVDLTGDFRVWGNPRPPTQAPVDFSLLKLRDIAGLNVTSMLGLHLGDEATSLAPLLNLTTDQVLALDWHVIFPLSIWSRSTATLASGAVSRNEILNGARTCLPPFEGASNSPCLALSRTVSLPANSISFLVPAVAVSLPLKLPDVQDPTNLASTATGLLDTTPAPTFPADLFLQTFGVPGNASQPIRDLAQEAHSGCTGINSEKYGLHWVTGDCALGGQLGSSHGPLILIVEGNLTLNGGTDFRGVIFLKGGGTRTVTGPSGSRAVIAGALLADGNVTGSGQVNLAYDIDEIRRAGYSAGKYAPTPGGWSDKLGAP